MFQSLDPFLRSQPRPGSGIGIVLAMYSETAIRFARAARSHLTRTSRQTLDRLLHFLVGGKVAGVGLGQALLDFH